MSIANRMRVINFIAHLVGALVTVFYFQQIDPTAVVQNDGISRADIVFFVVVFGLTFGLLNWVTLRWVAPLNKARPVPDPGPAGDLARQRALMLPAFLALVSGIAWLFAGVIWGVILPLINQNFELIRAVRTLVGVSFVSGAFVTAIVFFGNEHLMRGELPSLIPSGRLSEVKVPRLLVRTRMITVFLLLGLLPLVVFSTAALTRASAMSQADTATAALIIGNLQTIVPVLMISGLAVAVTLALLVASSVARPIGEVQAAMQKVQDGELDTRCTVVSNDEIGALAEGFNAMVQGLREREVIRETFGRYVSPQVRDEILSGRVSGDGAAREVSILFADLRNFTTWVESHPPAEVVADLNSYFAEMEAAIGAHGGLIVQFIGDEIEAVFGAPLDNPRHADDAVAAAREMSRRLDAWNIERDAQQKPRLQHGIGIHTGTVIAGNIGSRERLSYALVGDAVNLASRIQGLNKDFGTQMLVSEDTVVQLTDKNGLTPMPRVEVKGRVAGVTVFSLQEGSVS
ncbi:MAG: adenylate/guanylate cyclase domain-containing protein [Burkholderiaceae bacterium]